MSLASFRVSPFFSDSLGQLPVVLINDGFMVTLNEVLRFHAVVLDGFVGKQIHRDCFLTQGVAAVFLVAENAKDAAGTPCRQTFYRGDTALRQEVGYLIRGEAIQIQIVNGSDNIGLVLVDLPFMALITEESPVGVDPQALGSSALERPF